MVMSAEPTVTLHLNTTGADVRSLWERHGFVPTTDAERALRQRAHPHVEQCRCRFCEEIRMEGK